MELESITSGNLETDERLRFARLEWELNEIMRRACHDLMSSPARVERFAALFDRTGETGFYAENPEIRGEGEQPTWSPNPAYMDSLEELWVPAAARLEEAGLALERNLRELFSTSREYQDRSNDHRRVFYGQLLDKETRLARTFFMLTVPHSHDGFRYVQAPVIRLSDGLS